MKARWVGTALGVVSLLLLLASSIAVADGVEQFAQETGLDVDLVNVIQRTVRGEELTIVYVFINERTFDSRIAPGLRETLRPFIGRNAFYVNPSVRTVIPSFPFLPTATGVQQGNSDVVYPGPEAWREITPGFMSGTFEVNPRGTDQGSGSEGILVLGDLIDSEEPFDLLYEGQRILFDIEPAPAGPGSPAAAASHAPIEVPLLEDVTALREALDAENQDSAALAVLLGLAPDQVRTVDVITQGGTLRLVYVELTESVRGSRLDDDLVSRLEPLIGTGAVMVWAVSPSGAQFSPWNFYIQQGGTNYVFFSAASFVELTDGFLRQGPMEPGEVRAGVIRLPRSVNPEAPFSIFYGSSEADFQE